MINKFSQFLSLPLFLSFSLSLTICLKHFFPFICRYKEGNTHHTVLNSEEPSVLDLVSRYHNESGNNKRTSSTPTRIQTPLKEETREYYFGLNQNTNRHNLVERKRTEIVREEGEERRRRGGGGDSRASSKRGDSPSSSDRDSSPGLRSGTPSRSNVGTGGGSFFFGSENDPSYHKTVSKERNRERKVSGNGSVRVGINSPIDDPRPGVLYHKFRHT